ncbi:glycosyltransferase [Euzebya tangerina]|uniref:glycosyltransferase n=1 Tax=Euzebya tangerina TaxID=591198 RepID=UPI000E315F0B|nr:glycosyltransferase family 2 protein [Euzebya tangerina]
MSPTVSVVIPVYNDADGIRRCLQALGEQTAPDETFEVIVVDNRSDPPLALPPAARATLLREEAPGPYAARNLGARHAQGQILAFVDADCIPRSDFIEAGRRHVDRGVEYLAGRVVIYAAGPNAGYRWDLSGRDRDRALEALAAPDVGNAFERYEKVLLFDQARDMDVNHYAATANAWMTTAVFERVGPFDAGLRSGGDHEWGGRAHRHGVRGTYSDQVVVFHRARSDWAAFRGRAHRLTLGRFEAGSDGWRREFVRTRARKLVRGTRSIAREVEMSPWQRVTTAGVGAAVQATHLAYLAKYHLADPGADIQPERSG